MKVSDAPSAADRRAGEGNGPRGGNGGRSGSVKGYAKPRAKRGRKNVEEFTLVELLAALKDLEAGNFESTLPEVGDPLMVEIAQTFNRLAAQNDRLCHEVSRISRTVGREGKMNDRAAVPNVSGGWADMVGSVNALISDLVQPTMEIARVLTSVAEGDLSQKMVLEIEGKSVQGEFLRIGTTVNRMVDQLGSFASEVTRVAREVGTEGKLGGQAQVPGVAGTWKDLTDNVNSMARRLTDQVRNIRSGNDSGRERRPVAEDHGGSAGRSSRAQRTPSTRWSISSGRSHRKSRELRAKSAPKAGWAVRRTCRVWPARGRT